MGENVFPSTLAKLVVKWATHDGRCIVWNMEYNQMVRCQATKLSGEKMTHLMLSSVKPEPENMSQEQFLLTLSPQLLMKSEPVNIVDCTTQNNLSLGKKMQLITTLVDTILLEEK